MIETDERQNATEIINEMLSEEYEKNTKMVNCLNKYESIVEKDPTFIKPLIIKNKNTSVIFELIRLKIEYIKEALIHENSLEELVLKAFELLFILNETPNYDRLDEKISIFEIMLNMLDNKPESQKEEEFIKHVLSSKKEWKKIIMEITAIYGAIGFIFCVFLEFAKNIKEVVDFFIYYLKLSYICFVKFDLNELDNLTEETIINNFLEILQDRTNGFELLIKDKKIQKIKLDEKEVEKALHDEEEDSSSEDNLKSILIKPENELNDISKQNYKSLDTQQTKEISEFSKDEIYEKKKINALEDKIKHMEVEVKELKKFKKKVKIMKKDIYEQQKDFADLKDDMNLIKARTALKAIIDLFCKGLKLKGVSGYENKVDEILYKLNMFKDDKIYDVIKVKNVRILLRDYYQKLLNGNTNTHYMDLSISALDQIFKIIGAEKKY